MVQKQNICLTVGRFNPQGHNKNQLLLIESFIQAREKHPKIFKDWDFYLVGNINTDQEQQPYFDQQTALTAGHYFEDCQKSAQNPKAEGHIHIKNGISSAEIINLFKKTKVYIQGTGAFLAPGVHPEKCEHFGLAILEAASYGAIPLVYGRGGIFDILTPYESVWPYFSHNDLMDTWAYVIEHQVMINDIPKKAYQASRQCSLENFTKQLASFLKPGMIGRYN